MDTAAAAAAAVAVDLSAECSSKSTASKLLSKPKPKSALNFTNAVVPCAPSTEHDNSNCLGSTVESMSATPPPTPARMRCISKEALDIGNAESLCSLKDAAAENSESALSTLTSTSSTNSSTTPSSALLTPTTPNTNGTGGSSGNVSASSSSRTVAAAGDNMGQLLHWQDMPKYLQFNPYVLNGYRPLQTFRGCLLSLFYWHNETINILTHAIPIFYILAIVPGLMPWHTGYKFLSFCHVFGSVAPWCGSFLYHLFMNIERGENVYYTLLKLDMVGIWVSQSFGALPLVTATTLCFPPFLKWLIIISYCILSLWGLYKALTAGSPWQRRLCFALPFAMRSVLTFLRIRGMVGGSHMALSHVYLQDGVSILGGAIGAMRIPEKWFPGLVDFYLNSHNIMHVLVVVAVYSMHKATIKDFEWMSTQTCNTVANATEQSLVHMEL
ncbi:progestin and adipoQ receptor family member 4 isoform X2 [Drosophila busckii]|uniref:progestin and adipoQ receptor family member 4 isoform X2 n=1 Tax=Drosophila busckii TaxID=30019 RepID=UPI00083F103E|nr:progestin and adipoQ receptor family member 4 isoform X2 [Drosophila busckii]